MQENFAFNINVAQKNILVENANLFTQNFCKQFLYTPSQNENVDIKISLNEKDIIKEMEHTKGITFEKAHVIDLHRKLSTELIKFDTILFHGSCVSLNNNGCIFTAPSGTGKSTHAEKWVRLLNAKYVNDDKPYISIGDFPVVHGSPWMGKHSLGDNVSVPLKCIFILKRAKENIIEQVLTEDIFSELTKQTFIPKDSESVRKTLLLVSKLSKMVKVFYLHCNLDDSGAFDSYYIAKDFFE